MTPRWRGRLRWTFLLVWLATGCHYGGGDPREAEEQAPERLVITTVPGSGPQWHVEPDPDADEPTSFATIRAVAIWVGLEGWDSVPESSGPSRGSCPWNATAFWSMIRPFGQRTLVGARGHSLYIGDPRTGVIEAWEGSGSPITVLEVHRAPTEVSPSIRAAWLESRTARITDPAARREEQQRLEAVPFPEALPAFDALLAGPEGEIWLRDPMVPGASGRPRWSVIDAAGTVKAWATLPAAFRPMEIHDGHLLGVWTDALGVQTVRRFRLARR